MAVARRTGDLHRNFMGFHTAAGTDMVAFGITGIGDCGGVYLQNRHTLTGWERDLAAGRHPVQKGYRRTPDDHVRGTIIQELMCNGRATRAVLEAGGTLALAHPLRRRDRPSSRRWSTTASSSSTTRGCG